MHKFSVFLNITTNIQNFQKTLSDASVRQKKKFINIFNRQKIKPKNEFNYFVLYLYL